MTSGLEQNVHVYDSLSEGRFFSNWSELVVLFCLAPGGWKSPAGSVLGSLSCPA